MTNFSQGRQAEIAAAEFMQSKGFELLDQNWRTRWCEVDLVTQKGRVIYFCEVKYRQTSGQGMGLDYITNKKLGQMRFAAEFWVQAHGWQGEYQLAAIEVSGSNFEITSFVTDIW